MPAENGHSNGTHDPMPLRGIAEMLDHLTDGIAIITREGWIRYANQPAGEILGRRQTELVGRNLWEEFPDAIGGTYHRAFERAWVTGTPQQMVEYYEPLKTWFQYRIYPQEDKVFSLFRDVSEEQRTEEQLREHVTRIAEAERIIGFGVWEWDLESDQVRWSDELHRIFGLAPGGFDGSFATFFEYIHPDDRDRVWDHVSRALETLEPFAFEERIQRADGEIRKVIAQGRVLAGPGRSARAMVGVCHDVTERAQALEALGASERRLRAIVDNTPSMVTVKDLQGRYLMGNGEAARITGLAIEELLGKHCREVFPEQIAADQRLDDERAASAGRPVYGEVHLTRDGERRTYDTVTFPLRDEQQAPVETCTIATDVTERRERESERRERVGWTELIESALAESRLLAYAQPIVELATGTTSANELLSRLRTTDRPPVVLAPDDFLPAAERFGLIQQVDLWMVSRALALPRTVTPHVNLSAITLSDADARAKIVALLSGEPERAAGLVFEITETASMVRLAAAREFAGAVTDLGCRLALDDFGVGFGSFTYLRSLPLAYLKIDLSFVAGIRANKEDRRVVEGIIGIAREFGLQTIAEGVEDEPTFELLRELGADFGQGNHIGAAAPIAG
jgi:PAS domain S-box-containing protein